MNKETVGGTILKLVLLSFVVGMMLKLFNISPMGFLEIIPNAIGRFFELVKKILSWSSDYIFIGAVIVVPAYIILNIGNIMRYLKRKKS